jgi:tetratricopeptide (TPR) repeat protein
VPAVAAASPAKDHQPSALDQRAQAGPTESQELVNPEIAVVRSNAAQARGMVRSAKRAQRAGRSTQARDLYQRAILLDDGNVEAYAGLADACFDAGDHQLGLSYAQLVVRRAPHVARYRLQLGDAYYRVARHDHAIAQYRKAAALGSSQARRRLEQLDRG